MDMKKNDISYTVVAYNQRYIGRLVSLEVYKTTSKVRETNNYLTATLEINGRVGTRTITVTIPFNETIEKGKTYHLVGYGERAIATNRTTPIEALRDALNCLTKKHPTEFEPHLLSMAMGKIANTLRKMYQGDNIANVRLIIRQNKEYYLTCLDTEGNSTTIHNDFH